MLFRLIRQLTFIDGVCETALHDAATPRLVSPAELAPLPRERRAALLALERHRRRDKGVGEGQRRTKPSMWSTTASTAACSVLSCEAHRSALFLQ